MAKKVFVIGIGGTGMRCLESFIHTCAMGMYDNTEVVMLAIDTDNGNGNFDNLRKLKNEYCRINGGKEKADTFFSAKINYYEFSPGYTDSDSFYSISKYANLDTHRSEDPTADFVDLFLTDDVRRMSLKEGYRAQTQMGSLLMYYAIEKAAYEANREGLKSKGTNQIREFLSDLNAGQNQPVFIFGSVFGGTGASSIPVLPLAFKRANDILGNGGRDVVRDNYFGTIVLTNYFKFDVKASQGEVVARSENFAINSQSALMFYNSDHTVADTYRRLYLLGRSSRHTRDVCKVNSGKVAKDSKEQEKPGAIGGHDQENPADYIELLAAFAAYDFFKEATDNDKKNHFDDPSRFFCISHDFGDEKLDFSLFAPDDVEIFRAKMGALTVASILDKRHNFFLNVCEKNMFTSVDLDGEQMTSLHKYFEMFNFGIAPDGTLTKGWLHQMYNGRGGNGLLFGERLFGCNTMKDINNFKYNSELFVGENPPKFTVPLIKSIFDVVKGAFVKDIKGSESFDHLISRTYHTIKNLYNL